MVQTTTSPWNNGFPLSAESCLHSLGSSGPVNPADTMCDIWPLKQTWLGFSTFLWPARSSYCRQCECGCDEQPRLWISLVSSCLWASRCWFTASDHTEVTERITPSSCLLALILDALYFLCSPSWSNAREHASIPTFPLQSHIPTMCQLWYINSR